MKKLVYKISTIFLGRVALWWRRVVKKRNDISLSVTNSENQLKIWFTNCDVFNTLKRQEL